MENFWDFSAWGAMNLFAVLLLALLAANALKRSIPYLRTSLLPTSVLGGAMLLIVASVYKLATGQIFFETPFFGGNGIANLELLTYHMLALGFIASTFKAAGGNLTRQRVTEIFDSGVTTVSGYLIQGICGLLISIVAAVLMPGFFRAAGILLPFGYGQGTGQALNYGSIFENEYGFVGGKSFGLTIAALGFLSASIGGVYHLYRLKKKGIITTRSNETYVMRSEEIQGDNEIPMQESIDKMTVQVGIVIATYMLAFFLMRGLGNLLPGMRSVVFGFNFLLGVLAATLVKGGIRILQNGKIIKRDYINHFLMTRAGNFFFDIMVVAGIAAIRLSVLRNYWVVILVMGVTGLVVTYVYVDFVAKRIFPAYRQEQFLTFYGMLTGTASTGVVLLREIDPDFQTPAADNLVYQTFPAIVFGFPMMMLAVMAATRPVLVLLILVAFFLVMNAILFRRMWIKKWIKREQKY